MKTHERIAVFAAVAIVFFAAPAVAQDEVYEFGSKASWSVLGGPTGGGSFGTPGGGGFVGGELSLARLNERFWFGLYGDGSYDFGHEAATFTAGPQVGYGFFGLDGGVALRSSAFDEPGATARMLVTTGFFAIYGRYIYYPGAAGTTEHVGQIGVLVKFPVWAN